MKSVAWLSNQTETIPSPHYRPGSITITSRQPTLHPAHKNSTSIDEHSVRTSPVHLGCSTSSCATGRTRSHSIPTPIKQRGRARRSPKQTWTLRPPKPARQMILSFASTHALYFVQRLRTPTALSPPPPTPFPRSISLMPERSGGQAASARTV